MREIQKTVLRVFRKTRRPLAWTIMGVGLIGIVLTIPVGLTAYDSEAFWVTLAGFFLLFLDGHEKVADVEDELGSEASPNGEHDALFPANSYLEHRDDNTDHRDMEDFSQAMK